MTNSFLNDNPPLGATRSSYRDIYTSGKSDFGSCDEWESFVNVDLSRKSIDFVPIRLIFLSSLFVDINLNMTALICERQSFDEGDPLERIVDALIDTSPLHANSHLTINCNDTAWRVGACSSGLPAICANCTDPCLEAGRQFTLNCEGSNTIDAVNAIILDFDPTILPPQIISMTLSSSDKFSLSAHLSIAELRGSVVCSAYLSNLDFVPRNMLLLSIENEIVDVESHRLNYTISRLEPSSSYDVYCGTFSELGQAMSMNNVLSASMNTQCCQALLLTLSSTTYMDGSDYPNALVLDTGSSLPNDLVINVAALYEVNASGNVSFSTVYPFSQIVVVFSNDSLSTSASVALLSPFVGNYVLSVQLSGSSADRFEVQYGFGNEFEVFSSFQEPPTPEILSARFSSDGTRIEVKFDALTNRAGFTNYVTDCTVLFVLAGLDSKSACNWLSDSMISVFLSGDSAADVGDAIVLKSSILQAECTVSDCSGWSYSEMQTVTIEPPITASTPTIVISAASELGPCDDLHLDMSGSTGAGGRSWSSVAWSVESLQANSSSVADFLNTYGSATDVSLTVTVPASLLYAGFGYNVIVLVCNFLGACGRVSHYFSVSSVESVPAVTIASAKVLNVFRYSRFSVSGTAFIHTCDGSTDMSNIHLEWSFYSNGILLSSDNFVSVSVDPNTFLLPKYTLQVGNAYEVVLKAQHTLSKKYSSTSTSVNVLTGQIVAHVNVASEFGLRVTESISIDASASFDEDVDGATGLDANLIFTFQCLRIFPSFSNDCGLDVQTSASAFGVSVPGQNLSFVDHMFEITVFVSRSSDSRTAQTSVRMTILPSLAAAITLSSSASTSINPSSKLVLISRIDFPADGIATWDVDDKRLQLDISSLSPVQKRLTLPGGASLSRVIVSLVLPSGTLLDGSSYLFSLKVSLSTGYNSTSSIIVRTNSPPLPGRFSVTPSSGVEVTTSFVCVAFLWEDVDLNLPMTYEFAAFSPLVGFSVFRSRLQSTSTTTQLAAGLESQSYMYDLRLQVYDVLDGKSTTTIQVQVEPQSDVTDSDLSKSLTNSSSATLKGTIHMVSGVINSVDCNSAPNCTLLNRKECGAVPNKCGVCLDDFYGEDEEANSVCYAVSSSSSRRLQGIVGSLGTSCVEDSDCTVELMEECKPTSLLCGTKEKKCDVHCFDHGSCQYVSNYYADDNVKRILSECSVLDRSCSARCVCNDGYAGQSCELTINKFESAQNVRQLLIESYEVLVATENPTQDTVVSWLEGLAGTASHSLYLSEKSKELLVSLCSYVLDIAGELQLSYEDVRNVEQVLSLTLFGSDSSSLDSALELLHKYGQHIVSDLQVGQNPIVVAKTYYRLSAFSADGFGISKFFAGRSSLEIATDVAAQTISVPAMTQMEPYMVLLVESISSTQSDATAKELYQSVPLEVWVDRSLCNNESSCAANITLLNFEFGEHTGDESRTYFTNCLFNEEQQFTYPCPSGYNVTAYCNGTMNGLITSNCSVHVPISKCDVLSDSSTDMRCTLLDYTADYTVCRCILPTSVDSSWKVEYVSVAATELINSTSSFSWSDPVEDDTLNFPGSSIDVKYSYVLYVIVVFVVYMLLLLLVPALEKSNGTEDHVPSLVSSPQEHLDDGLPIIFTGKPILKRMFEELILHHKWSCALFRTFKDGSTKVRLLYAFTSTCFVFLLNCLILTLWVTFDLPQNSVVTCLLAAILCLVSAPASVLFNYLFRYISNASNSHAVTPAAPGTLRLEYRGLVSSVKELSREDVDNEIDITGELDIACIYCVR